MSDRGRHSGVPFLTWWKKRDRALPCMCMRRCITVLVVALQHYVEQESGPRLAFKPVVNIHVFKVLCVNMLVA